MMTIISYFLSHIGIDSTALSKSEYYEMSETTRGERQNSLYIERLEDVEVRICPRQHQKPV